MRFGIEFGLRWLSGVDDEVDWREVKRWYAFDGDGLSKSWLKIGWETGVLLLVINDLMKSI